MPRYLLTLLLYLASSFAAASAPGLLPDELRARTVQVAIYDEAPFAFQKPSGRLGGIMIELWEAMAADFGLDYEYTVTDMDGLLSGINEGRYDIGLGAITITPERESLVDFSQPVNPSGTGIIAPRKRLGNTFVNYIWPITVAIIILFFGLLALLLVSGTLVWWVERNHQRDPGHRDIDSIEDGLWWSAVTVSTIGYGDKVPQTRLGRAVGVLWIFAGLVMLSLFTANASAIFTVAEIEHQITTTSDLRRVRVGAAADSSGQEFLSREQIRHIEFEDLRAALDAMLAGEVDAVVSNVPVARFLNNTEYQRRLTISPKYLLRNNMGIAMRTDCDLAEHIDRMLLVMLAEPKWQQAMELILRDR